MYDPNLGRHLVRSGGLNEYQAQALPYTVLSSMGKGFLNAAAGSVVGTLDLALTVAQLSPMTLEFGQPIYHIPPKFYTPFTVGNSQVERASAAFGEFGFYALDAYLGASGAVRGGFSAAREELAMSRVLGDGCFVAGTPVQMADGTTRAIERIKPGDFVKSRNPETGMTEAKRVLQTTIRQTEATLTLSLTDSRTGHVEAITTTSEHPFYVDGKGFVKAGDLGIGTSIVTRAGPCLTLSQITSRQNPLLVNGLLPTNRAVVSFLVHNLIVEGDHTYFVGITGGGAWVHNLSKCAGLHHFVPMGLGSRVPRGSSILTPLTAVEHSAIHDAMAPYLRGITKTLPGGRRVHMFPTTGNSTEDVVRNFTPLERQRALEIFHEHHYNGGAEAGRFRTEFDETVRRRQWR